MPPTDFCKLQLRRADANPGSFVPRRDGGQDLLPFLTRQRPLPCGSGDARRAALRPADRTPLPVPPGYPRFARPRCSIDRATYVILRSRSVVTIDEHVPKDRVKDASSGVVSSALSSALAIRACVWLSHADDVPLLGVLRATVVIGACARTGRVPCERRRTDRGLRSAGTPRRVPTSGKPGCLPP